MIQVILLADRLSGDAFVLTAQEDGCWPELRDMAALAVGEAVGGCRGAMDGWSVE
jgi:hypothetical protein